MNLRFRLNSLTRYCTILPFCSVWDKLMRHLLIILFCETRDITYVGYTSPTATNVSIVKYCQRAVRNDLRYRLVDEALLRRYVTELHIFISNCP